MMIWTPRSLAALPTLLSEKLREAGRTFPEEPETTVPGRGASAARLRRHVRKLEGERHARTSPAALAKAGRYIADELEGLGLEVTTEPFVFRGETYENIVARQWGASERPGWARARRGSLWPVRRMRRAIEGMARDGGAASETPLLRLGPDGTVEPRVRVEERGKRRKPKRGPERGSEGRARQGRGLRRSLPRVLIGAHFDTIPGTPGADDNASGVAGMLEAARILSRERFAATIEYVAFNLEELQTFTYRLGSRAYVEAARRKRVRYAGALVLEMIGYRSTEAESQRVPKLISWKAIPATGDFLAVAGDGQSAGLLRLFRRTAAAAVPELPVVAQRSPLRGWLVASTRLSDNASFWSEGYPSLMITDTAFLRNPHYHRATDTHETLDFGFMARVTDATVATAAKLARGRST